MLKRNIVGLMIIFFIWGFVVCLNDLLTPIMKSIFLLNQFQANLVAFVFFIAYFIGSVAFNIFNRINRLDFKSLMLLGFVISGCGSLFFIPAATIENYWCQVPV